MARHAHEFQCNGRVKDLAPNMDPTPSPDINCGWYNYPWLDDKMTGNFTIICGHCKHKHYRCIVNGVVTEDRHSDKYGEAQILHVLPAQTSATKRQLGSIAMIRQMEAAGRMS
jgi:hypothetical protein